ncbi:MAG: DUF4168 domain-containing protein [Bacteroidetes bacterium]|nr:DUF4168 domain-containing protein [Bacteroidota bacterium]
MNFIKAIKFTFVLWFTGLSGVVAIAQITPQENQQETQYSSEKLQKFVEASKGISTIHQHGEEKMIAAIEQENLDIEKFNQIAEMKMNQQEAAAGDVSDEDIASFERVMPELQIIQMQMQQEMEIAIEESGMEVEEYTEIMEAYRADPEVQEKINELLMEE